MRNKNSLAQTPDEAMRGFLKKKNTEELAKHSAIAESTLYDRYNPNREYHKLGYKEAIAHALLTGDHSLAVAFAKELGLGTYALPTGEAGEEEILDVILKVHKTSGNFASEFYQARADGIIDAEEAKQLSETIAQEISLLTTLSAEIQAQVREKH